MMNHQTQGNEAARVLVKTGDWPLMNNARALGKRPWEASALSLCGDKSEVFINYYISTDKHDTCT